MKIECVKQVMTAAEAEKLHDMNRGRINKACAAGFFKDAEARKSGGTWLVTKAAVDRFLVEGVKYNRSSKIKGEEDHG